MSDEIVTEHAQEYSGGNMLVWPNDPELYEIFPLELRLKSARLNGGKTWRRRVIVVSDWEEVTGE